MVYRRLPDLHLLRCCLHAVATENRRSRPTSASTGGNDLSSPSALCLFPAVVRSAAKTDKVDVAWWPKAQMFMSTTEVCS